MVNFTSCAGSGITLNATVAPLMRQLGIYDEFVAMSNIVPAVQVGNEEREIQFSFSNYFDEATTRYRHLKNISPCPIIQLAVGSLCD